MKHDTSDDSTLLNRSGWSIHQNCLACTEFDEVAADGDVGLSKFRRETLKRRFCR